MSADCQEREIVKQGIIRLVNNQVVNSQNIETCLIDYLFEPSSNLCMVDFYLGNRVKQRGRSNLIVNNPGCGVYSSRIGEHKDMSKKMQ